MAGGLRAGQREGHHLPDYESLVRLHVRPTLGRTKLGTLPPPHVQTLYRKKLDEGLSPKTVKYIHTTLHRALKQAVRWGLVPRNVVSAADPPRGARQR